MKRPTADYFNLQELLAFQCGSNIHRAHASRKEARIWHRKGEVAMANAYRKNAVTYMRYAKERLAELRRLKDAAKADAEARAAVTKAALAKAYPLAKARSAA